MPASPMLSMPKCSNGINDSGEVFCGLAEANLFVMYMLSVARPLSWNYSLSCPTGSLKTKRDQTSGKTEAVLNYSRPNVVINTLLETRYFENDLGVIQIFNVECLISAQLFQSLMRSAWLRYPSLSRALASPLSILLKSSLFTSFFGYRPRNKLFWMPSKSVMPRNGLDSEGWGSRYRMYYIWRPVERMSLFTQPISWETAPLLWVRKSTSYNCKQSEVLKQHSSHSRIYLERRMTDYKGWLFFRTRLPNCIHAPTRISP